MVKIPILTNVSVLSFQLFWYHWMFSCSGTREGWGLIFDCVYSVQCSLFERVVSINIQDGQVKSTKKEKWKELNHIQTFQLMQSHSGCVTETIYNGIWECNLAVGGFIQLLHNLKHQVSQKCIKCDHSYRYKHPSSAPSSGNLEENSHYIVDGNL